MFVEEGDDPVHGAGQRIVQDRAGQEERQDGADRGRTRTCTGCATARRSTNTSRPRKAGPSFSELPPEGLPRTARRSPTARCRSFSAPPPRAGRVEKAVLSFRIVTPQDVKDQIWLEAYPRGQQDAANFHHPLSSSSPYRGMSPFALMLVDPNGRGHTNYQFYDIVVNPVGDLSRRPVRTVHAAGLAIHPRHDAGDAARASSTSPHSADSDRISQRARTHGDPFPEMGARATNSRSTAAADSGGTASFRSIPGAVGQQLHRLQPRLWAVDLLDGQLGHGGRRRTEGQVDAGRPLTCGKWNPQPAAKLFGLVRRPRAAAASCWTTSSGGGPSAGSPRRDRDSRLSWEGVYANVYPAAHDITANVPRPANGLLRTSRSQQRQEWTQMTCPAAENRHDQRGRREGCYRHGRPIGQNGPTFSPSGATNQRELLPRRRPSRISADARAHRGPTHRSAPRPNVAREARWPRQ